eukprot:CAMPEP_0197642270 /NCGR_PEP_ID=MMETSP1338-20131121/15978_1 /TAXON_ID=43686 ORGANISM="Pelagodinium beii, Strain RCC1491" /NCGR_SAMPLE_ID=MMETSP1338 /ASSEMBLY_ACC=CAM_ASM_000754 /LENGTH=317 /DNA_ID=CAMNT_0043215367 /DNA_START=73 /DNA_END=1026 /DNA_ORIENTATION=+
MSDDVGKVFVGGLPKGCTNETLETWGMQFGMVSKVDIKLDPMGTPRGFAFVTFDSQEGADASVANKDNNIVIGKWIDVKPAGQPSAPKGGGKGGLADANNPKMFIGALPKSATEDSVTAHFSQYGALSEVLVKFAEDGTCKGYAFITFEDAGSAKLVLDNYDNNMFEGKWIDCKSVVQKGGGKDGGKGKDMGKGMWGGGKDMGGKGMGMKGGKDKGKGGFGGKDGGKGGYGGGKGYGGKDGGYGGDKGGYGGGKSFGKSAPPAVGYGSPAPAYGGYSSPPAYGGYSAPPSYGAPPPSYGGYGPAPGGGKGYGSAPYW